MMTTKSRQLNRRRAGSLQGFSLIELMLAVSLMSVIVFGLYSMFNETQKALRANVSQVDVLESGRAAIERLVSDFELAATPELPVLRSLPVEPVENGLPHFVSGILSSQIGAGTQVAVPTIQRLEDDTRRTNIIHETFFLTRSNLNWVARGFFVSPSTNPVARAESGEITFGTLFRFASPNVNFAANNVTNAFLPQRRINFATFRNLWEVYQRTKQMPDFPLANRVVAPLIDGVVHFKVQPLDSMGRPMRYWTNSPTAEQYNFRYPSVRLVRDAAAGPANFVTETRSEFYGASLPAAVEVEIGVMDPAMLSRAKSFGNAALSRDFISRQPGGVHLFRRIIPLRSAPNLQRTP